MNSQYFEKLEILFKKKEKGITGLLPSTCRSFEKCQVHFTGNFIMVERTLENPDIGEIRYTIFNLKEIKELRTTFPKIEK